MTEPLSYKMYTAEMIKLIKATLEGTIKPLVPFSTSPLEFCQEAHKVKDELMSNALGLLENDIPITKQIDGWVSFLDHTPEAGQRILVGAEGKAKGPFLIVYNPISHALKVAGEMMLMTHWMPLPEPPTQESET